MILEVNKTELELIKKALEYLSYNVEDAEQEFEAIINEMKLEELRQYIDDLEPTNDKEQ